VLRDAKVSGDVSLNTSRFAGDVDASSMTVGGSLLVRDGEFDRPFYITFAHIGRDLDLSGSSANSIDLTGTVVLQDFVLGGLRWACLGVPNGVQSIVQWPLGDPRWRIGCVPRTYTEEPRLILRDMHAGSLESSTDTWPPVLDLDGFKYDRFGRFGDVNASLRRARSPQEWQDWLERDRTFNSQTYAQLATVLASSGDDNALRANESETS